MIQVNVSLPVTMGTVVIPIWSCLKKLVQDAMSLVWKEELILMEMIKEDAMKVLFIIVCCVISQGLILGLLVQTIA